MILAHLSDLHLRDESDAVEFDRQLDCIAAEPVDHLIITGDLLDRWNPPLLERALDSLGARGFLDPARVTIIHGNHDLPSSGGHPREQRDLLRLALRFWDPPPLLRRRRRRFYSLLAARSASLGIMPPFRKELGDGLTLAALDSVPFPWVPFTVNPGGITLQHARGAIRAARARLAGRAEERASRRRDAPLPARRGRLQLAVRPLAQRRLVTLAVAPRSHQRHRADGCG